MPWAAARPLTCPRLFFWGHPVLIWQAGAVKSLILLTASARNAPMVTQGASINIRERPGDKKLECEKDSEKWIVHVPCREKLLGKFFSRSLRADAAVSPPASWPKEMQRAVLAWKIQRGDRQGGPFFLQFICWFILLCGFCLDFELYEHRAQMSRNNLLFEWLMRRGKFASQCSENEIIITQLFITMYFILAQLYKNLEQVFEHKIVFIYFSCHKTYIVWIF